MRAKPGRAMWIVSSLADPCTHAVAAALDTCGGVAHVWALAPLRAARWARDVAATLRRTGWDHAAKWSIALAIAAAGVAGRIVQREARLAGTAVADVANETIRARAAVGAFIQPAFADISQRVGYVDEAGASSAALSIELAWSGALVEWAAEAEAGQTLLAGATVAIENTTGTCSAGDERSWLNCHRQRWLASDCPRTRIGEANRHDAADGLG